MTVRILFILAIVSAFLACPCAAQEPTYAEIKDLQVAGNNKTRSTVIEREMTIHRGDVIPASALEDQIKRSRESLLNTGLFNAVEITVVREDPESTDAVLVITVSENWYLFPAPNISFGERGFSNWIDESKASFNKINWGLKLYHLNFTGRNDYLKIAFQQGRRDNFQFKYRFPYLGKQQQFQLTTSFDYSKSQEVAYATIGNEELIFSSRAESSPFRSISAFAIMTYRPGLYVKHNVGLSYRGCTVSDSILYLNPEFFTDDNQSIQYFSLSYSFEGDYRDRRPIATEGYRFQVDIRKDGLGVYDHVNQATLTLAYEQYFKISDRFTAYLAPRARFHFTRQSNGYFFNDALGSGSNSIRGYEGYVIDGKDYLYAKTGLRFKAFETTMNLGKFMPIDRIKHIPLAMYIGANFDTGLVYDPDFGDVNKFDNRVLMGYGPSVHLLVYERFLFGVEYNFNILQESGIQLHSGLNF